MPEPSGHPPAVQCHECIRYAGRHTDQLSVSRTQTSTQDTPCGVMVRIVESGYWLTGCDARLRLT